MAQSQLVDIVVLSLVRSFTAAAMEEQLRDMTTILAAATKILNIEQRLNHKFLQAKLAGRQNQGASQSLLWRCPSNFIVALNIIK